MQEKKKADSPHEMDGDDLIAFTPPSPEFANNTPTEQNKMVEKVLKKRKPIKSYKKLQVMRQIAMKKVKTKTILKNQKRYFKRLFDELSP